MAFWLGDIPSVMRSKGWNVGAACMERWFRYATYRMSQDEKLARVDFQKIPRSMIDNDLVKMQWAMRFNRVRDAVARLRTSWNNEAAYSVLQKGCKMRACRQFVNRINHCASAIFTRPP